MLCLLSHFSISLCDFSYSRNDIMAPHFLFVHSKYLIFPIPIYVLVYAPQNGHGFISCSLIIKLPPFILVCSYSYFGYSASFCCFLLIFWISLFEERFPVVHILPVLALRYLWCDTTRTDDINCVFNRSVVTTSDILWICTPFSAFASTHQIFFFQSHCS